MLPLAGLGLSLLHACIRQPATASACMPRRECACKSRRERICKSVQAFAKAEGMQAQRIRKAARACASSTGKIRRSRACPMTGATEAPLAMMAS